MVEMIIKGLFRRYERWNPVHPTSGAFWGIGIGIGCGVGWGPGFGPEVVGYVGAGCGAGFSVGVTFAGIGIGLPANYVYSLPYSVIVATKNVALEAAQSRNSLGVNNWTENIHGLQLKAGEMVSAIGSQNPFEKGLDLDMAKMRTALCSSTKHAIDQFERISGNFFHPNKGNKN